MKIKAIILALVFLFGGSGFSIDIATCCSKFSSLSFGLNAHKHETEESCCKKIKPIKKKCCDDIVIQTVINSVQGPVKANVYKFQADFKLVPSVKHPLLVAHPVSENQQICTSFDHHYPIPILIRKRVLLI